MHAATSRLLELGAVVEQRRGTVRQFTAHCDDVLFVLFVPVVLFALFVVYHVCFNLLTNTMLSHVNIVAV